MKSNSRVLRGWRDFGVKATAIILTILLATQMVGTPAFASGALTNKQASEDIATTVDDTGVEPSGTEATDTTVPDEAAGAANEPAPADSTQATEEPVAETVESATEPATETPAADPAANAVLGAEPEPAPAPAVEQGQLASIELNLADGASITLSKDGNKIDDGTNPVDVPANEELKFTAQAADGWQVDKVKTVIDSVEAELTADANGEYKVAADKVTDKLTVKVEAKALGASEDPEAESTEMTEEAVEGEEAETNTHEGLSNATGVQTSSTMSNDIMPLAATGDGTDASPYIVQPGKSVDFTIEKNSHGSWAAQKQGDGQWTEPRGYYNKTVSLDGATVSNMQNGSGGGWGSSAHPASATFTASENATAGTVYIVRYGNDYGYFGSDYEYAYFQIGESETYTITYHANNGTDEQNVVEINSKSFEVAGNTFEREGYRFIGWATDSSAIEVDYNVGDNATVPENAEGMDLYAVWSEIAPSLSVAPYAVRVQSGSTTQLNATVYPEGSEVKWSSDSPDIATVDENGLVTGVKEGTATIYASANGLTAVATVTVVNSTNVQTAYFYGVKPSADPDSTGNDSFFYVGTGAIDVSGLTYGDGESGADYGYTVGYDGGKNPYGNIKDSSRVISAPSEETIKQRNFDEYKDEYGLTSPDEVTISWTYHKLTYVSGAPNQNNQDVANGALCWHVDMNVTINTPQKASAQYFVQQPGDSDFTVTEQYVVDLGTQTSPEKTYQETEIGSDGRTYTFDGWYTDRACTQKAEFPYTIDRTTQFFAKYVPVNTYNVEYDGNGNTSGVVPVDKNDYESGKQVTVKYGTPEKTGYEFESWSDGNGNVYKAGDTFTMPQHDVTLTAQWKKRADLAYTINYYKDSVDEANFIDSAVVENATYGAQITLSDEQLNAEQPEGYAAGVQQNQLTIGVDEEANVVNVVYAARDDVSYTVRHWFQNIDNDDYTQNLITYPDQILEGTTDQLTNAQAHQVTGFVAKEFAQKTISGDETTVVDIYYDRNVYAVTYQIVGSYFANEDYSHASYRYGANLTLIADDMTQAGYVWSGWSGLPSTMPADNVTVTGFYNTADNTAYTVRHWFQNVDDDGYSQDSAYPDQPMTGTTGESTAAQAHQVTGFVAQEITQQTIAADGTTIVDVYYDRNVYDVNYLIVGDYFATPEGDVYSSTIGVRYGAALQLIADDMQKTGFVWNGWTGLPATMPADNVTVTGYYTADTTNLAVTGYSDTYDGLAHGVTVSGALGTDEVKYFDADGNEIDNQFVNVTNGAVSVTAVVSRDGYEVWSGTATVQITPAPLTVVTQSAAKIFDGAALTAPGEVTGFVNGETADWFITGTITMPGQVNNTYDIDWASEKTTALENNYAIDFETIGKLTVYPQSIDPNDPDPDNPDPDNPDQPFYNGVKVTAPEDVYYNGLSQEQDPIVTDRDGNPIDPSYYDVAYSEDTVNAGTVTITVTGKNGYTGSTQVTYDILKVDLTIVTPSAGKVFDGAPLVGGELTASGWQDDDATQVTLTATGSITNVGSAYNTYTASDPDGVLNNYNVIDNLGVLTVWPQSIDPTDPGDDPDPEDPTAPDPSDPDPDFPDYDPTDPDPEGPDPDQPFYTGATVDDPESVPYDGGVHQWVPTVTDNEGNTLTPGEDYTVGYSTDDFTNVGTITVTITGTGNYGGSVEKTYQITPAQITVNIENQTKVEGSADPTFTFNYSGVVEGEAMAWTGEFVREVGETAGDYAVTQGGFVLADNPEGNFDASNYTLVVNPGTLTITAATTPGGGDEGGDTPGGGDTPDTPTPLPTPDTPTPVPTPAPGDGGATPTDGLTATTGDDAEEAIDDEAAPLTAPEPIDDDATPLATNEHRDCWVHWLMLLGILVTVVYYGGVGVRRVRFSSSLQSFEDDVLGNDETNR